MSPASSRVHDVSRPLRDGGTIYPGDPQIAFRAHASIDRGDPANVSALALGSHSGTHVDAPSHFIPGGSPVDRSPLERLIGPAAVLDLPAEVTSVGAAELARHDLRGQRRVLLLSLAVHTRSPRPPMREAQEGVRRSWRRRTFGS